MSEPVIGTIVTRQPEAVRVLSGERAPPRTLRQEFGAIDAALFAIVDLCAGNEVRWADGNLYAIKSAFIASALPNDKVQYPSLVVRVSSDVKYVAPTVRIAGPNGVTLRIRDYACEARVRVAATNATERAAIMQLVEDTFMPEEGQSTVRCVMPYYFGMPLDLELAGLKLTEEVKINRWYADFTMRVSGTQVLNEGALQQFRLMRQETVVTQADGQYPLTYPRRGHFEVTFDGYIAQS